jgi:C4-dicarboxylate-specific signal transduction histidine kinase
VVTVRAKRRTRKNQPVLVNLITNGIDAMKDIAGDREWLTSSQPAKGQGNVTVSDTGMGLPTHGADQIFKAFFTTKDHGTGLGLSISRSIVESHGGRLAARAASGRGAAFQFALPVTTSSE